jgi:hypothetical protein
MTSNASDLQTIARHLEKLNRENRWLKIGLLLSFITAVLSLSTNMVGSYRLQASSESPANQIKASTIDADTITAHKFLVNGKNGQTMLSLTTVNDPDQPVLQIFGPEPLHPEGRVLRMTIGATPDPSIVVYHAWGPLKNGNDALFSLTFLHNEPQLMLRSGKGNLRGVNPGGIIFSFTDANPSILLRNSKGRMAELSPH